MKKYKYVRMSCGALSGVYSHKTDGEKNSPRQIIDNMAEQGYRFAGYVPVKSGGYGFLLDYDLVFERDI